jgi:hypothetical protein
MVYEIRITEKTSCLLEPRKLQITAQASQPLNEIISILYLAIPHSQYARAFGSVTFLEGPTKDAYISPQELNLMLEYYYAARGWTKEGVPTLEKLKELGLEEFANQIYAKPQMR